MSRLFTLWSVFLVFGCSTSETSENFLFEKIPSTTSNIHFGNTITENETLNILDYEYLYNGGGVGVADFNLDGLQDIFFTGNMVSSALYLNQGGFSFKDVTQDAGVATSLWCTGVSIVDINNDGKPDIYVSTAHDYKYQSSKNYFFINTTVPNGPVRFENLAKQMNLECTTYSEQAVWLDYDLDGDLDVFIANNSREAYPKNNPFGQRTDGSGNSTDRLYRNLGNNQNDIPVFEDISMEAGISIEGWSLGVAVLDINEDNYPDIYVANDFMSNDLLYVNNGDGTFVNRHKQYFKHQSHNSMGIDVADINNDAALDILVLDMLPEDNIRQKTMFAEVPFQRFNASLAAGYQPQFVKNVLQVNTKHGSFSDLAYLAGVAATDWSWAPLIADFDNDGLRDIYITNGYKKDITDMDFVDFNQKLGTFGNADKRKAELLKQTEEMAGVKKSNFYFKNLGDIRFEETTKTSGLQHESYSNGAVYADFDNDGDLDMLVNNINQEAFLFRNRTEQDSTKNHLRIGLEANAENLGAKVSVFTKNQTLFAEYYPHKGYLSSFEPVLHFGLGEAKKVDSIVVTWIDNQKLSLKDIAVNQQLVLEKSKQQTSALVAQSKQGSPAIFDTIAAPKGLDYKHKESTFDDFKKWPLRFRSYSRPGPVLQTADINADGIDDVFVGGTSGNSGLIFTQNTNGEFTKMVLDTARVRLQSEDAAAIFFDADGDGDQDLYCAKGSSENYSRSTLYQDVLYINDGNGRYTYDSQRLPLIAVPTETVVALDFDNDGDQDLFVGGRLNPDNYPMPPRSYLLENQDGYFKDVTAELAEQLQYVGMVTDAFGQDINKDGWEDLVVVGEGMPITIFYNSKGALAKDDSENGFALSNGWWNCMNAADFDNDGDIDFVVGNWGLNTPLQVSETTPLRVYATDFNKNGSIEPVMTKYVNGTEHIVHPRNTIMSQLPMMRKITSSFEEYGRKSFPELLGDLRAANDYVLNTYTLASTYVENLGNGAFAMHPLPREAQWSPIFAMELMDVNTDGKLDILTMGNFKGNEALTGYANAGNGVFLVNKGNGVFEPFKIYNSGFVVPGEARSCITIKTAQGEELIVVGLQTGQLQFFKRN